VDTLYGRNGLVFWTEKEIRTRQMLADYFVNGMRETLRSQNKAFEFLQVEAPLLTPINFINKGYTAADIFIPASRCSDNLDRILFDDLALRPETTMGSYRYAEWLIEHTELKTRMPLCVWQHGKSFRREQDQVTKNMRLKEFYQLEFQAIYGLTTANDYSVVVIPVVCKLIADMIGPCRIEASDRIPDYSEGTTDIVCERNGMEVCSISKRKDYLGAKVLEVAIGTDRCVYNFLNR